MSSTIWKFELDVTDVQRVRMPAGARLLTAQGQPVMHQTLPMLWALVDPSQPTVERLIALVGTGHPAPDIDDDGSVYVGTAICGLFVWHVFDGGENHAV